MPSSILLAIICTMVGSVLIYGLVTLYRLYKSSSDKTRALACKYALDNYDNLMSAKFGLITEYRLRVALKTASSEDAVLINYIINNQASFGHPIDSYVDTVIGAASAMGGIGPTATTVVTHIYGISRADLLRTQSQLRVSA